VLERAAGVVWRIDINAFHLAREVLLQRLESEQIVAVDEPVIKNIPVRDAMRGVIRLGRVFEQDARLQLWPVLLPRSRSAPAWFSSS